MGAKLRHLGILVLALVAVSLVAESAGWFPEGAVDEWLTPVALGGVGAFTLGAILSMLSPVGRLIRQGHCVRCGVSTERGQSYCNDHLKETIEEAREHSDFHRLGSRG
jgi:hypothetical protein